MRGFQLHRGMLDSYEVHIMPPDKFMEAFYGAVNGEQTALSRWVRPWNGRLEWKKWREIRESIFKRDNYTCQYCGETEKRLECDHIHPVARGGSNDPENLTTACYECNRSKRDKTLEEWRGAA